MEFVNCLQPLVPCGWPRFALKLCFSGGAVRALTECGGEHSDRQLIIKVSQDMSETKTVINQLMRKIDIVEDQRVVNKLEKYDESIKIFVMLSV